MDQSPKRNNLSDKSLRGKHREKKHHVFWKWHPKPTLHEEKKIAKQIPSKLKTFVH